jgi:hypothetical protein
MKANAAWQNYENQLNFNYEKQKRLTEEKKRLSLARATSGASGTQMYTGSSLLVAQADMEEFETDMWYLEKGLWAKTQAQDAQLAGEIANANFAIGQSLFQTAASVGQYQQKLDAAKTTGSSDSRLKENVQLLYTLDNGINVYRWEWNSMAIALNLDHQPTHGVMAQELKEKLPDAVTVDKYGFYLVDYSHPEIEGVKALWQ